MTEMERQQLWSRKVLDHYLKGHFLKSLKLLADNDEDRGNVPSMLWALCQERRPADYVFKLKGGQRDDGKHGACGSPAGASTTG